MNECVKICSEYLFVCIGVGVVYSFTHKAGYLLLSLTKGT